MTCAWPRTHVLHEQSAGKLEAGFRHETDRQYDAASALDVKAHGLRQNDISMGWGMHVQSRHIKPLCNGICQMVPHVHDCLQQATWDAHPPLLTL